MRPGRMSIRAGRLHGAPMTSSWPKRWTTVVAERDAMTVINTIKSPEPGAADDAKHARCELRDIGGIGHRFGSTATW